MDSRRRNAGLFLVAATLTGGMYVANTAGLAYLPPVFFASLRFLIAAALLLPYVALRSESLRPQTRTDYLMILAGGGVVVAAANVFLFIGQQYTTSASAAIIISLSPILSVGLAAAVLPGERLTPRRVSGVIVGLLGVGVVVQPGASDLLTASIVGEGWIFLAALALAVGGVALRRLHGSLSSLSVTAWATVVGGLTMLALSVGIGEPILAISWSSVAVMAVVYNGIVATPLGYVAYFTLLDTVGPVRVNLLTYVAPLVTAVAGWLLLGEAVSRSVFVGFVVIAAGFALVEYQSLEREVATVWRLLT